MLSHKYLLDYRFWNFLNFGPSVINWVKVFYKGANSCIYNNGHLSSFFRINRGVRQGCPLSPYLFIIGIEILSYAIRNNNDIIGTQKLGSEIKNVMFADDATFILDGSEKSFNSTVYVLDAFERISGLKLNPKKCTILRIGSLKTTDIKFLNERPYKWTSSSAKTLGVIFTTDKTQLLSLNLEPKIKEFKRCLKLWEKRNLTTLGKITVIKTFALPKLIYPLTVLPNPPNDVIIDIKKYMNEFIWKSKVNKVSQKTIIKDYDEGGLKMIDIESFMAALKASWVKRILDNNNKGLWKMTYIDILDKLGGEFFFSCNCQQIHTKNITQNEFLENILQSWCKINYNDSIPILNQILWNNSKILNVGKPIVYKNWLLKGIKYISQLVHDKKFITFNELQLKFNLEDREYLKYYKLISSIPKLWKQVIKDEVEIEQPDQLPLLSK